METGKMRDTESSLALQKNGKTQQVKYYGLTGIQKMGGKNHLDHCWSVGSINIEVNSAYTSHVNRC